jgi:hypothetical protein
VNASVLPRATALDEFIVLHFVNMSAQHSPHMLQVTKIEDKGNSSCRPRWALTREVPVLRAKHLPALGTKVDAKAEAICIRAGMMFCT